MISVVILAGGKGSRVSHLTDGKSKAEIKILKNKSIIGLQLDSLTKLKKSIYILSNYKFISLKSEINKYQNNNVKIIDEELRRGTAGCLKVLENIKSTVFLIIAGDLVFNMDFNKLLKFHLKKKSDCTLVVHPNNHPQDSDLVEVDKNSKVINFYNKSGNKKNIRNLSLSGIFVIKKNVFKIIKKDKFQDFSKDIIPLMIKKKKKIFAYITREYIKDAGTPGRIAQVQSELKSFKYKMGNINKKIPAIFLDKDGVINRDNYNFKYQSIKIILPGVFEAIKKINQSGFLCILVTNQPAVAKGFVTLDKLKKDLDYLEYKLGLNNCFLDRIYFCPCHPDKGFVNEVRKFKRVCNWRKPNNGMLLQSRLDLNIDFKKSYMIGDTYNDYLAAKKTGVKFVAVGKVIINKNIINKNNLHEAVSYILKNKSL